MGLLCRHCTSEEIWAQLKSVPEGCLRELQMANGFDQVHVRSFFGQWVGAVFHVHPQSQSFKWNSAFLDIRVGELRFPVMDAAARTTFSEDIKPVVTFWQVRRAHRENVVQVCRMAGAPVTRNVKLRDMQFGIG